jgi:ribosomal protein S18 acetylase RimI-like enzyme
MPEIEIRSATAIDIPGLVQMEHTSLTTHVWQMERLQEEGTLQTIFREVRLPRPVRLVYPRPISKLADNWQVMSIVLIAVYQSNCIGYLTVSDKNLPNCGWIYDLVVTESMRRKGIASALVLAGQDWASRNGLKRVVMEMQSKNFPAIRLAQKLGYEFCGYNDHYYANQDLGLFFGKFLK